MAWLIKKLRANMATDCRQVHQGESRWNILKRSQTYEMLFAQGLYATDYHQAQ